MLEIRGHRNRTDRLILAGDPLIASYTLDGSYVTPLAIVTEEDEESVRVLPLGTVLALNPANNLVVPNYTSYGFGVLGVLKNDSIAQVWDDNPNVIKNPVVNVVFDDGIINVDACWDNGTRKSVLAATRSALQGRINFIDDEDIFP